MFRAGRLNSFTFQGRIQTFQIECARKRIPSSLVQEAPFIEGANLFINVLSFEEPFAFL